MFVCCVTIVTVSCALGVVISPPPPLMETMFPIDPVAVFETPTGMMNEAVALAAKPLATVQVTTCNALVQPDGIAPGVNELLSVSLKVVLALVETGPLFVTEIVKLLPVAAP